MAGIEVERTDLLSNELFELLLRLKDPTPEPIVVWLESSDALAVSVPRQVRFEKGEREKTISLRTARDMTRMTSVTLKARIGDDRRSEVETGLRVQPAYSPREGR